MRDISALIAFIDSRQKVPHKWGRDNNDCVGFCLAAIEAQTGQRIAPSLEWKTGRGAVGVLGRLGGLEAAIDKYLTRIPPALAKRGDIGGVADETFGIHPVVVEGETLVGPSDHGNRRLKRRAMITAWSALSE